MKRRAKRDLGILLAIIIILGSVAFFNGQMGRVRLANEMDQWRRDAVKERQEEGIQILTWDTIRKTKGSLRNGATFPEDLYPYDNKPVNVMGFMVPHETYRNVTEFLFLPLPIECYFCQIPPEKDVMFVTLKEGETAQIFEEPVLVNGTLELHEGPGVKFFYTLNEASLGPGEVGADLHRRKLDPKHLVPGHEPTEDELLEPVRRTYPKD